MVLTVYRFLFCLLLGLELLAVDLTVFLVYAGLLPAMEPVPVDFSMY